MLMLSVDLCRSMCLFDINGLPGCIIVFVLKVAQGDSREVKRFCVGKITLNAAVSMQPHQLERCAVCLFLQ